VFDVGLWLKSVIFCCRINALFGQKTRPCEYVEPFQFVTLFAVSRVVYVRTSMFHKESRELQKKDSNGVVGRKRVFRVNNFVHKYTDNVGWGIILWIRWASDEHIGFSLLETLLKHRNDDMLQDHSFEILIERLVVETLNKFKEHTSLQFQGILLVRTLVKFNPEWLTQQPVIISHLRRIWSSHSLFEKTKKKNDANNSTYWREIKLLAKCLLTFVSQKSSEIEILFQLLKVYVVRSIPSLNFIKNFLESICKTYTVEEKRSVFFKFVECFHDQSFNQDLKAMILQHVIIPMFEESFKQGETDVLIGGPPNPENDSPSNIISVFVNKVIDPEHPFATNDSIRILLLQFSALLVEHAGAHIHDAANRKQGNKLKRLYIFAWPCLLSKQCVDPATKYHGF
jgi:transformation/transcription domain-associated protein